MTDGNRPPPTSGSDDTAVGTTPNPDPVWFPANPAGPARSAAEGPALAERSGPPDDDVVVLVVDDEVAIVDLVELVLRDEGFVVLRAYDGRQAWTILETRPVDLVLSDVMMPMVNGLDLLRRIRASADHARLPVILMSAVNQIASPGIVFLPKPFDIDDLIAMVIGLLDVSGSRGLDPLVPGSDA